MSGNKKLDIGGRLRKLRKVREITLEKVAEDTGMSYSFLSALENNKHSISLDNLQKLAEYFQVDMVYFLEESNGENSVIRKGERPTLKTDDGIVFQTVTAGLSENMQLTFVSIPPNTPDKNSRLVHAHSKGDELITVTKGEVTVIVEERKYLLKEGDTVIFPAEKEHVIYAGNKGGEIILIGAPPYGRDQDGRVL